ncbi:MAG: sugar transferase, partial [Myxococcota bacterium]
RPGRRSKAREVRRVWSFEEHGRPFTMLKLRTMRTDNAGASITADGDSRITPIGRILRKTKLDELPELWNVARGDMSLVGPRPEVPQLVDLESPLWREVLLHRPGITDPVTLRLRNEEELLASASNPETFYREVLQPYKLRGYAEYGRLRSTVSDVRVLVDTALAVLRPSRVPPPTLDELQG